MRGDREREGLSDRSPTNLSDRTEFGRTSLSELFLLGVTAGESDSDSVVVGDGVGGFFFRFGLTLVDFLEGLAAVPGTRVTFRPDFLLGEAAGAILGLTGLGESSDDEATSITSVISCTDLDRARLFATSGLDFCFGMFKHESLLFDCS
jgi:hypothetical protein